MVPAGVWISKAKSLLFSKITKEIAMATNKEERAEATHPLALLNDRFEMIDA